MTQSGGFIPAARRPGVMGIHSLDAFAVAVPDLAVAEQFLTSFGLRVQNEHNGFGIYTAGSSHRWGGFIERPTKQLSHLSFGAFEDDLPAFRARLEAMKIPLLDPPPGFDSNGLWFRDPDEMLVEIKVAEKSSPNEKSPVEEHSAPGGKAAAPKRSLAGTVQPRRLAHILLFTKNVDEAIRFYSEVLGLRLSDRSGDAIAFMHGVHGSDHHMVAFVKSEGPGLHHICWDVGSIHEVGLGAMQMADRGFSQGWGLGRHVLGSNYFHYVRDPWGSYCEYSYDIDYIPATVDWQSGDYDAEDAFYVWGPTPPADFAVNKELQR